MGDGGLVNTAPEDSPPVNTPHHITRSHSVASLLISTTLRLHSSAAWWRSPGARSRISFGSGDRLDGACLAQSPARLKPPRRACSLSTWLARLRALATRRGVPWPASLLHSVRVRSAGISARATSPRSRTEPPASCGKSFHDVPELTLLATGRQQRWSRGLPGRADSSHSGSHYGQYLRDQRCMTAWMSTTSTTRRSAPCRKRCMTHCPQIRTPSAATCVSPPDSGYGHRAPYSVQ